MMTRRNDSFAVWLGTKRVGTLQRKENYTWFAFEQSYLEAQNRPILGLRFEDNLRARYSANMRLPVWFSNLLPEGRLRTWIADQRGVSISREMELLAQIGHDLPGAVRVLPAEGDVLEERVAQEVSSTPGKGMGNSGWRFSLAGVVMKFSMVAQGERFCAPASGESGDWIVKLPMAEYSEVPLNEFTMMTLARQVGIEVPETKLVHRDLLPDIPPNVWSKSEHIAYAIRRFDRTTSRDLVHIEDFAQVRDVYPGDDEKYRGSFETLGALVYRGHDLRSLLELVRRLAFNIVIRNGDAHLKNWSLIYRNPTLPTLSPAYDLVSTAIYRDKPEEEDLGLKLAGTRRFQRVSLASFDALQFSLESVFGEIKGLCFREEAERTAIAVATEWPSVRQQSAVSAEFLEKLDRIINIGVFTLLRTKA